MLGQAKINIFPALANLQFEDFFLIDRWGIAFLSEILLIVHDMLGPVF